MREIKFRVWTGTHILPVENLDWATDGLRPFINEHSWASPNTLMQFTGLKDKNGVEIYEGDIVKDWEYIDSYSVVWNKEWACFELSRLTRKNDTQQEIDNSHIDLEVIGNIYENPELLEQKS